MHGLKISKIMKEKNNVISAGIWYTISNFFMRGIGFLTTPFFARMMSTEEYGIFSNFSIWLTILTTLTTLDLFVTVSRAIFDFKNHIDEYLSSILVLGNICTLVSYLIVYLNKRFFVTLFGLDFVYIQLIFLYLLVCPSFNMFQFKERQNFRYKTSVIFSLISTISSVGFSFIGVLLLKNKLVGRLLGYIGPLIILSTILYFYILLKGRKITLKYWKYSLKIAVPLIPHTLSGNILGTSDQIIIKLYCGASHMAVYNLAYTCSLIISILWQSLNQAMAPWINLKLAEGRKEDIKEVSYYYLMIFIAGAVGIMLIGPEAIRFMGGEKYSKASNIMPIVMTGCIFQFTYSLYVNVEIFYKKTIQISMATLFAALLNLILNLIFVPKYGYIAAAYTTLIGYVALLFFHYNTIRFYKLNDVYDNKFIFTIMGVMIIFMFFVLFLYKTTILRWTFLAIYSCILIYVILKFNLIKKLLTYMNWNK